MGDEAAVSGAAAEVDAAWGRVDALINNAGWMPGRGRVGQPQDIVALAAFLCSDLSSHLSGTVITVRPLT